MRNILILGFLLIIMVGCNKGENPPTISGKENNLDWQVNNEGENINPTDLGDELSIEELRINDSHEAVFDKLGDPVSEDELKSEKSSVYKEISYKQQYFLIRDEKIVGFGVEDPSIKPNQELKLVIR